MSGTLGTKTDPKCDTPGREEHNLGLGIPRSGLMGGSASPAGLQLPIGGASP